ncbi:MAG TPA: tRNA (adenosine(37)-N6)-threonylcarbamoyltransferase complex dimerization subunit type 1 TsaB [Chloroflexia bacterium]|jgi:tRNA threonylcarbamoyladenosine biosynthesis protein TsaB|nr:tRNA (adenosine(37)-N6)-threonylcarbamoyltransferase complex dimerization subunit type 1 TsaB [Chloroflexia bacterium]
MIVAFDTSTEWCSVALYDPTGGVRAEETWHAGREQTRELLPTVHAMLERMHLAPADLRGVAVALGPGSFTGLRVGLATAKGLAYALDIPLWGIPTLDIMGYAHMAITAAPVCAVLHAGRGRLAHAFYRTRAGVWQRISEYANTTVAELIAQIDTPTIFCGEIDPAVARELETQLGRQASVAPSASSLRRAGYLAELAWQRAQQGERDDVALLQPLYLHVPTPGSQPVAGTTA